MSEVPNLIAMWIKDSGARATLKDGTIIKAENAANNDASITTYYAPDGKSNIYGTKDSVSIDFFSDHSDERVSAVLDYENDGKTIRYTHIKNGTPIEISKHEFLTLAASHPLFAYAPNALDEYSKAITAYEEEQAEDPPLPNHTPIPSIETEIFITDGSRTIWGNGSLYKGDGKVSEEKANVPHNFTSDKVTVSVYGNGASSRVELPKLAGIPTELQGLFDMLYNDMTNNVKVIVHEVSPEQMCQFIPSCPKKLNIAENLTKPEGIKK